MSSPYLGQCACRAIRYECREQPLAVYNCHCQACQLSCGAPFSTLCIFPADSVKMSGAAAKYYADKTGITDHIRAGFCDSCGTPLFAGSDVKPDLVIIRATTLSQHWFKPVADIWTISARPDIGMNVHIPKVYRSPPLLKEDDL